MAELDGELVGCIGVIREQYIGKYFSDFKPELQPYLRSITIMRAVKASMRFVEEYRGPLVAVSEDADSAMILTKLGFTHLQGELFGWLRLQ